LAYADWSPGDYQSFHDAAFEEIFNRLDFGYFPQEQMERAEELFELGFLNFDITEEERDYYRLQFSNLTNLELERDDWETYRELYDQANG
jgi:hypothetical protein